MNTCDIVIKRRRQFVACAVACEVILDGASLGRIKVGDSMRCQVREGYHEIQIQWWRKNKSTAFGFVVSPETQDVTISTQMSILREVFVLKSKDVNIEKIAFSQKCQSQTYDSQSDNHNTQHDSHVNSIVETSFDDLDGSEFENWCANLLRNNGFINVEVTQASGDQGVDILAIKNDIKYAIQCKCYSHDLGNSPVQEVHAGKSMYNCHIGVVMTNRHFTKGAKELSKATGVLLWDREKLLEMLSNTTSRTGNYAVQTSSRFTDAIDANPQLLDAIELAVDAGKISTSLMQRRLGIGYGRAAQLIDKMEELGVVSKPDGTKPRKVLISAADYMEMFVLNNVN